jgi:tRNA (cmo5U34)-methyltransferase
MHYILQFIDPRDKDALILKAYEALQPGGVLLLSEKVDFSDPDENTFQREYHHIFKGLQGYSDLEIAQKQAALKNVLKLDTIAQHKRRLNKAGFGPVYVWYQCCNFISLAAVRS